MTYKHKTHAVDSDGKVISNADVDFYIDDVSPLASLILCVFPSLILFLNPVCGRSLTFLSEIVVKTNLRNH